MQTKPSPLHLCFHCALLLLSKQKAVCTLKQRFNTLDHKSSRCCLQIFPYDLYFLSNCNFNRPSGVLQCPCFFSWPCVSWTGQADEHRGRGREEWVEEQPAEGSGAKPSRRLIRGRGESEQGLQASFSFDRFQQRFRWVLLSWPTSKSSSAQCHRVWTCKTREELHFCSF